jgi:hypothetical protein
MDALTDDGPPRRRRAPRQANPNIPTPRPGSNTPLPPKPLNPDEITAWLDYLNDALRSRRDEVVSALRMTAEMVTEIEDDELLGEVAENVRMASAFSRTCDERRTVNKRPFLDGGRAVDAWFKQFVLPLDDARFPCQRLMDNYGARKLARERAAAEAVWAAAAAEAEAATAYAAAALDAGRPAGEALDRAATAQAAAAAAQGWVDARPAELTASRGAYGAAVSVRETWYWEITDADAVPKSLMMVDPEKVKLAGKERDASGRPVAVIPGISWVSRTTVGVR